MKHPPAWHPPQAPTVLAAGPFRAFAMATLAGGYIVFSSTTTPIVVNTSDRPRTANEIISAIGTATRGKTFSLVDLRAHTAGHNNRPGRSR